MSANRIISRKTSATVIAAELVVLILGGWLYAGMPGFFTDTGPATVTVQFAPAPPAPPLLVRAHKI